MEARESFNPYSVWLGIPISEQPPDFYRLIGVARFEPRPEVLRTACDNRARHITTFSKGLQAALARRILQELASARATLLNPTLKKAYDARLNTGAPPAISQSAQRHNAETLFDAAPGDALFAGLDLVESSSSGPLKPLARKQPKKAKADPRLIQMAATAAAILCLAVVGGVLYLLNPSGPVADAGLPTSAPPTPTVPPNPNGGPPLPLKAPLPTAPMPQKAPRTEIPPKDAPDPKPKAPVPDPVPPAPPKPTPVAFTAPPAVELPAIISSDETELAVVSDPNVQLTLHNPEGNRVVFQLEQKDGAWFVARTDHVVGRIENKEDRLTFCWAKELGTDANAFRNTVLTIASNGEQKNVVMRKPHFMDDIGVDLTKEKTKSPLKIELHGLRSANLKLHVSEMKGAFRPIKIDPPEAQNKFGSGVAFILRQQAPYAAIDVRLTFANDLYFLIVSPLMGDEKEPLPFTEGRTSTFGKNLIKEIKRAEDQIPRLQRDIAAARSRVQSLSAMARQADQGTAFNLRGEIVALNDEIAGAQQSLAGMQAGLNIWPRQLASLGELDVIARQVHDKSSLAYRVFYQAGPHEVNLVVSQPVP